MPDPCYVETLRLRLRAVIAYRDTHGLSDAVAAALNDLECRIAWAERAFAVAVRRSFWRSWRVA